MNKMNWLSLISGLTFTFAGNLSAHAETDAAAKLTCDSTPKQLIEKASGVFNLKADLSAPTLNPYLGDSALVQVFLNFYWKGGGKTYDDIKGTVITIEKGFPSSPDLPAGKTLTGTETFTIDDSFFPADKVPKGATTQEKTGVVFLRVLDSAPSLRNDGKADQNYNRAVAQAIYDTSQDGSASWKVKVTVKDPSGSTSVVFDETVDICLAHFIKDALDIWP